MAENGHDSAIFQRSALNESLCAVEGFVSRLDGSHPPQNSARDEDEQWVSYTMISHSRRQGDIESFNPIDTIGSTGGCPTTRLVTLLGVAADCTYTSQFDSLEDARENIISQVNIASQMYRHFQYFPRDPKFDHQRYFLPIRLRRINTMKYSLLGER